MRTDTVTGRVVTDAASGKDSASENGLDAQLLGRIALALAGLRYGSVQIIVQDSRVVQIDRTEKLRLGIHDSK